MSTAPIASGRRLRDRIRGFLAARLESKTYLGLHLTISLIVACGGIWLLSALIDAVLDNATLVRLDLATDAWIHARVSAAGLHFFVIMTDIGSPAAMTVLAIVGGLVLLLRRRPRTLVAWTAAFAGGFAIENILKRAVHRTRPPYGAAYLSGHSFSFPSGHATGSLIGYTMLAYVLIIHWRTSRPLRTAIVAVAALIVLLVGISRIYLGVHYPSDVLGGWVTAAVWVAVCLSAVGVALHRSGRELPEHLSS
jgi:undecaprenyl-diphosphatase